MANMILLFIFVSFVVMIASGAIGAYIMGEKGKSTKVGFLVGALIPIISLIGLAMVKSSDEIIAKEMYARDLMTLKDYEKTVEVKLKK